MKIYKLILIYIIMLTIGSIHYVNVYGLESNNEQLADKSIAENTLIIEDPTNENSISEKDDDPSMNDSSQSKTNEITVAPEDNIPSSTTFEKQNSNAVIENSQQYQQNTNPSFILNGICLIDHGSSADVGVAYEGTGLIQFRWLEYNIATKKWTEISSWNTGNWITWNTPVKGDYWIYVEAKDEFGNILSSVYGHHVKGIQVNINGICLLDNGSYYDAGVAYESNDDHLLFRWQVYDLKNSTWTTVSDWKTGNWISWYPNHSGDYWLHVEIKDSLNNIYTYTMGIHYNGIKISLDGICTIKQQKQIDIGVAYTTNDKNIKFRWKIYDLKYDSWTTISDWSSGNWVSWYPNHSGDYWLYVEARTSDEQIYNYVIGYHVESAKITSFSTNIQSPYWINSTITLNGTYEDVIDEVGKQRYLVYDGNSWQELNSNVWNPTKLGNYLLCYEIYNKNNDLIAQSFLGFSIETPFVNIKNINVYNHGNFNCSLVAQIETNDRNIQYHWMYYDINANQWGNITDWTSSSSVTWNSKKAGAYWIYIEAKLSNGETKNYTIGYFVQQYSDHLLKMINVANNYSSDTQYIALVDRSAHKVAIMYGSKGYWSPIKYWDCADGKASTPTVAGVFKIQNRGYYFDSGNSRCFWWTQFYGNYLFHTILCNKDGSIQDGRVGMALSHGCVRLEIENAKWIYDNLPRNTTVVVY